MDAVSAGRGYFLAAFGAFHKSHGTPPIKICSIIKRRGSLSEEGIPLLPIGDVLMFWIPRELIPITPFSPVRITKTSRKVNNVFGFLELFVPFCLVSFTFQL